MDAFYHWTIGPNFGYIYKVLNLSLIMAEKECIFCKISRKEVPAEIILETGNFIAIPDAHPKVPGHTLIIPKKHFQSMMDMPESLGCELLGAIKRVFELKAKEGAEGFNIIVNNLPAAGQLVPHVHIHLLPRKAKDGKNLGL
jgi:histidine triad (HIT) family protein